MVLTYHEMLMAEAIANAIASVTDLRILEDSWWGWYAVGNDKKTIAIRVANSHVMVTIKNSIGWPPDNKESTLELSDPALIDKIVALYEQHE